LNIENLKSVITGKTSAVAIVGGYRGTTLMGLMILEAERGLEFLVGGCADQRRQLRSLRMAQARPP
jgi:hypothetical protein